MKSRWVIDMFQSPDQINVNIASFLGKRMTLFFCRLFLSILFCTGYLMLEVLGSILPSSISEKDSVAR